MFQTPINGGCTMAKPTAKQLADLEEVNSKFIIHIPRVQHYISKYPVRTGKHRTLCEALFALLSGYEVRVWNHRTGKALTHLVYHDQIVTKESNRKYSHQGIPLHDHYTSMNSTDYLNPMYEILPKRHLQYNYATDLSGPFGAILGLYYILIGAPICDSKVMNPAEYIMFIPSTNRGMFYLQHVIDKYPYDEYNAFLRLNFDDNTSWYIPTVSQVNAYTGIYTINLKNGETRIPPPQFDYYYHHTMGYLYDLEDDTVATTASETRGYPRHNRELRRGSYNVLQGRPTLRYDAATGEMLVRTNPAVIIPNVSATITDRTLYTPRNDNILLDTEAGYGQRISPTIVTLDDNEPILSS